MIFKGHLTRFFPKGAFAHFLSNQGVLLKDFDKYVKSVSSSLKSHAQKIAKECGRPYIYLEGTFTKAKGQSKEEFAKHIAERDQVKEGLICVLGAVELCHSFTVVGNKETHKLEVIRKQRKCLHFYFYFVDPEFGFIHVRLQSWFPFEIQVYINGREWLSRQLDREGIGYKRYENSFISIDNLEKAQKLCEKAAHRKWAPVLSVFAKRVNPMLSIIERAGFGEYYWCIDQCEHATDVMFKSRADLQKILPDLFEHASLHLSAENVMKFLGRKLHGNFQGEVITDLKKRPQGWRVKHHMKRNSLKMYDKWSNLRIENTINNPSEFKVLRETKGREDCKLRWMPMGKGVANFWRYYQVSEQANRRYLDALAHVPIKGEGIRILESLCRSQRKDGKRYAKFNPVSKEDCALFAAVMAGEHHINGFRNRDLCKRLYAKPASTVTEARRRCARISRLIAKLRGHKLLAKVKNSFLYRVTELGRKVMIAALSFRQKEFPLAVLSA